jgi:hypothetical protein
VPNVSKVNVAAMKVSSGHCYPCKAYNSLAESEDASEILRTPLTMILAEDVKYANPPK